MEVNDKNTGIKIRKGLKQEKIDWPPNLLLVGSHSITSVVYLRSVRIPINKDTHINNKTKVNGKPVEIAPACKA